MLFVLADLLIATQIKDFADLALNKPEILTAFVQYYKLVKNVHNLEYSWGFTTLLHSCYSLEIALYLLRGTAENRIDPTALPSTAPVTNRLTHNI